MTSEELKPKIDAGKATLQDAKDWACATIDEFAKQITSDGNVPMGLSLTWFYDRDSGATGAMTNQCRVSMRDTVQMSFSNYLSLAEAAGMPLRIAAKLFLMEVKEMLKNKGVDFPAWGR